MKPAAMVREPIRVELPWPYRELFPNSRSHWGTKASKTKKARTHAHNAALAAGIRRLSGVRVKATPIFTPPSNRGDVDNMQGALKAYHDGIADALGIDDRQWDFGAPQRLPGKRPGSVTIEIEVMG